MGNRLGIIAGSGTTPFYLCERARHKGYACVVAAVRGEADPLLEQKADAFSWISAGEASRLFTFFRGQGVSEAVFAGKFDPRIYFDQYSDEAARTVLALSPGGSPVPVTQTIIRFFAAEKIAVIDPSPFLEPYFCEPGLLTRTLPRPAVRADMDYGFKIARTLADLDIGQTVVVKNRTVVAVEGMEGTNRAIERAGILAGKGVTAVKVCRSAQDPRIDLPAVGLETVRSLVKAGGAALCFEARRMPFFEKEEAAGLADQAGMAILARSEE
jgi:hypothetical protein